MSEIIVRPSSELASEPLLFHRMAAVVADSLSPTSRRVYDCTFRAWCKFADEQGFSRDLHSERIDAEPMDCPPQASDKGD